MSLLTSLALDTAPLDVIVDNPNVIVEAKCTHCGAELRFLTDPRKDAILLGRAMGECRQCKTPTYAMTFDIKPTG